MYDVISNYAIEEGPEIFMCYVNDVSNGLFMGFLFLVIFLIVAFSNFFVTKKMTGSGDFPVSMTLGSFTVLIFSIMLRLVDCPKLPLTSDLALGTTIGVALLSVLVLFFSKN